MKRALSRFALLVMIAATVACGHSETADETPAFVVSSDSIVNAFLADETAANQKFNDQIIEVSGPVMELTKENGQVSGVKISSDEFNIVNCSFQHPVSADEIPGDRVTVKGVCSGFLGDASSMLPGGTVEIKRAALVE